MQYIIKKADIKALLIKSNIYDMDTPNTNVCAFADHLELNLLDSDKIKYDDINLLDLVHEDSDTNN